VGVEGDVRVVEEAAEPPVTAAAVVSCGKPEDDVGVPVAVVGDPASVAGEVASDVVTVAGPVVAAVVTVVVGATVVVAAVVGTVVGAVVGVGVGTAGRGWSGADGSGVSAVNAVPSHRVVPGSSSTSSQGSRRSSVRLHTIIPSRY